MNKLFRYSLIFLALLALPLRAAENFGRDTVTAEWFREWYQWGELKHYLDNHCDFTTYMTETTGEWGTPEGFMFSINGNSYRWNKYYLDGFRVDSRILAGDAFYTPDMFAHSMSIDYNRGTVEWEPDSLRDYHVRVSGQGGNVGGYSLLAKWLQELQEGNSAIKRRKDDRPLNMRKHIVGAGSVDVVYGIPSKGKTYTQHAFATYGRRRLPRYDFDGISGMYDADYYQLQLDGQLPIAPNKVFDRLSYIFRAAYRADGQSEFGYNDNEIAHQLRHSFSLYGTKNFGAKGTLTTGLTYGLQRDTHNDLEFSRNFIDIEAEVQAPWYPDGHHHELNWAVNYRYQIQPWLHLHVDGYNSLMVFRPRQQHWSNRVYLQGYNMPDPVQLYDYQWTSEGFCGGILENAVRLEAAHQVLPWLHLSGEVAATFDGLLVGDKSLFTPNWEAKIAFHIEPVRWFRMDIIAANYRVPYTYDQIRFLSNNYLSGEVYYAGTNTLLTTTGGKYHRLARGLWQPQYVAVDIPFVFTIGRHEISVLSSFKKYYNTWSVRLAPESADSYEPIAVEQQEGAQHLTYDIYRMTPQERYYEVCPAASTGTGFFDSPVFLSNVIKYTYNGKKVFVSFSWQSYMESGVAAIGNGIQTEDLQILDESLASPNAALVDANMHQPDAGIRSLARMHQDRAFIARLQLGVNITENWQLSMSGKFRDGIPISSHRTYLYDDGAGHAQAITWATYTRGINVRDGNFGQRTDSFFNFDLRLKYRNTVKGVPFEIQAVCYNILDFATELNEYSMAYNAATGKGTVDQRYPLSLCTPRGLLLTCSVGLPQSK